MLPVCGPRGACRSAAERYAGPCLFYRERCYAMRICFLDAPSLNIRNGNVVTSERWQQLLTDLGHEVVHGLGGGGHPHDLLVVFNAYKNRQRIREARQEQVADRIIVCVTGTDLYEDMRRDPAAQDVFQLVDRIVVLHPEVLAELPAAVRHKATVVFQSAVPPAGGLDPVADVFQVCVIAHLRPIKDPLRAAHAARLLPAASRVRVVLAGAALTDDLDREVRREAAQNRRFVWLGGLCGDDTSHLLAASRLLVVSSFSEGGANVVSEAVVAGVPVLGTAIPCLWGLLGADYPGLFPAGDTDALARLLWRAETDSVFYGELQAWCAREAAKFTPAAEREALRNLLADLFHHSGHENLDVDRSHRQ